MRCQGGKPFSSQVPRNELSINAEFLTQFRFYIPAMKQEKNDKRLMVISCQISAIGLFFCLKSTFWSCCHLQDLKTRFYQYNHLHLANMQIL